MSEMATAERAYVANRTRILELIEIAQTKVEEAQQGEDKTYWVGVVFGLRRALGVIEGRG